MAGYTVRPYQPGDDEALLALHNRVFSADDPNYPARTIDVWRHIYLDNPLGNQIFVAEADDGNLIANYSALPAATCVRGERRQCSQIVDSVVDGSWRGALRRTSLFAETGRAFAEAFCTPGDAPCNDYVFGLPNDQAFPVGGRFLGYLRVLCPVPRLVREFDAAWIEGMEVAADGTTVDESDWSDLADMEALYEATVPEIPLGLWRSADYLAWRYRHWPEVDYRVLCARRDGALVGVLVFRLGWFGHPIAPLVDWIGRGADRAASAALLATAARITRDAGGRRLETWVGPVAPRRTTLLDLGLAEEPSPFNLSFVIYTPDFDLPWVQQNLYMTMGDFDVF